MELWNGIVSTLSTLVNTIHISHQSFFHILFEKNIPMSIQISLDLLQCIMNCSIVSHC